MYLYAVVGSGTLLLEFLIFKIKNRHAQRVFAACMLLVHVACLLFLARNAMQPLILCVLAGGVYRVFNMLRVVRGRMHPQYLKRVVVRTSLSILAVQTLLLALLAYTQPMNFNAIIIYSVLLWSAALFAAILLITTIVSFILAQPKKTVTHYTDHELPTISVLIPARNETKDLAACIRSVLASDYPKLEIIVLDDCSTDKTVDVIRGFAQDGVRFINIKDVDDTWLPKNQAYQTLLEASSGKYVLFCGVDVRFAPGSIRNIVAQLLEQKLTMISLLPQKYTFDFRQIIFQPLRYFWELSLPRFLSNRPPVLSTAWLASRQAIVKSGGFAAARRMVTPEAYFSRLFNRTKEYKFIFTTPEEGVQSVKGYAEQRDTALRTRYPQLHRKPEMVFLVTLLEIVLVVLPLCTLVIATLYDVHSIFIPSVITTALLIINYTLLTSISSPANSLYSLVMLPVAVLADLVIMHVSMWNYECSEVRWKDRNICIPVMHVVPKLPNI